MAPDAQSSKSSTNLRRRGGDLLFQGTVCGGNHWLLALGSTTVGAFDLSWSRVFPTHGVINLRQAEDAARTPPLIGEPFFGTLPWAPC